jgi:hypothetical protein
LTPDQHAPNVASVADRLPIAISLTRLLTRGLDLTRVGRVLRSGPLLPQVDEYLGLLRRVGRPSTLEVRAPTRLRLEAISRAIRVAPVTALVLGIAAAVGGVVLAVGGQHWAAAALFVVTGVGLATSVLAWLTDDGIGLVLSNPWRSDAAWVLVVLLFGVALPLQ